MGASQSDLDSDGDLEGMDVDGGGRFDPIDWGRVENTTGAGLRVQSASRDGPVFWNKRSSVPAYLAAGGPGWQARSGQQGGSCAGNFLYYNFILLMLAEQRAYCGTIGPDGSERPGRWEGLDLVCAERSDQASIQQVVHEAYDWLAVQIAEVGYAQQGHATVALNRFFCRWVCGIANSPHQLDPNPLFEKFHAPYPEVVFFFTGGDPTSTAVALEKAKEYINYAELNSASGYNNESFASKGFRGRVAATLERIASDGKKPASSPCPALFSPI